MSLRTAIVTDRHSVLALIPAWNALAERGPRSTPYASGSLMIGLGSVAPNKGTPYIATAHLDSELVGVLPLRRVPAGGRLGGHRVVGYSGWHASYFDAIVDPAFPVVTKALLDTVLVARDWERFDLRYLLPDGNILCGETGMRAEPDGSSQILRRRAFADHAGGRPPESHKTARRLAKEGEVRFTPAEPLDQIEASIARFTKLHTLRWGGVGDSAEFAAPDSAPRLARVIREAVAAGIARVGTLRLSGEIIAVHIAFRWGDSQFSWRMAHDAQWQARSPGRLLCTLMIEEAFASGCETYDLGRGADKYKRLWPTEARPLHRVVIPGRTWRTRLTAWRQKH